MGTASPETDVLARVRPSCATLLAHATSSVHINMEKVRAFVAELDVKPRAQWSEPMLFPLHFRSQQDELNFLMLYGLLNFGSGFRKDLHKYVERGAHDTIVFGLMGMYISVPKLDAPFLQHLSIDLVASYFGIPLEQDEEISPGIYMAKPILNECGKKLVELKVDDLGAFVLAHLSLQDTWNSHTASPRASAVYLVNALIRTFPGFDDHNEFHGEKVYFFKRAQLAVACIYRRFKDSDPKLNFTDIHKLTALVDNVLPCVLHALGILEYDVDLETRLTRGEDLPAGQKECEVRAAAIVACDQIVAESQGRISTLELDVYLRQMGKDERFRRLERHATRDTFFY